MTKFQAFLHATRPKTLFASLCPVGMGVVLACRDGHFAWLPALAALAGALLIQIGTNFANDYFDFKKGADTAQRLGPVRVTQAGLIAPNTMKWAYILAFAAAALIGLYLIFCGGWPIFWIGFFSIICGILYTGGPYPLGYLGLGDLFVLIFFGPVAVAGTYYVQALQWAPLSILLGLSPGLFSVAILTANNLRDVAEDTQSNKKTLVVRWGTLWGKMEYTGAVILAALLPIYVSPTPSLLLALPALTLVAAFPSIRRVWTLEGKILNQVLADTGKLLLIFTLLFCIGWLI